jgi:hypothetical protein
MINFRKTGGANAGGTHVAREYMLKTRKRRARRGNVEGTRAGGRRRMNIEREMNKIYLLLMTLRWGLNRQVPNGRMHDIRGWVSSVEVRMSSSHCWL